MNYLIVTVLFIAVKAVQSILIKLNYENRLNKDITKKEIEKALEKMEKKMDVEKAPIFHLRAPTIFQNIKDIGEAEKFRNKLKSIAKNSKFKPLKNNIIIVISLLLQVIAIYSVYLFFYEKSYFYLSLIAVVFSMLIWIINKRYLMGIIFGVFCILIYFKLPSTIILYLLLNFVFNFTKIIVRKIRVNGKSQSFKKI